MKDKGASRYVQSAEQHEGEDGETGATGVHVINRVAMDLKLEDENV